VEAESQIDSNVLARLLRSLSGSLRHLIIHIDSDLGGNISDADASCYRLTENTTLESIKVICTWVPAYRDMYKAVITNLIGSICSPHLRSVDLNLDTVVGELEFFPWGVVNNLTKASPHMLQRVDVTLRLSMERHPDWGITVSSDEYEVYFCQVRSALPELDKKVIMSVTSQRDIFDAVSSCDNDYDDYDDYDDYAYDAYNDYNTPSPAETEWDDDGMTVPKSYILRNRW